MYITRNKKEAIDLADTSNFEVYQISARRYCVTSETSICLLMTNLECEGIWYDRRANGIELIHTSYCIDENNVYGLKEDHL